MGMAKNDFNPDLWFVAIHEDEIVGLALNKLHEGTARIDHLSVLGKWRKKGIGKALMLHSLEAFREQGISIVKLNVDSGTFTNAPNLYRNVGFETVQQYHWLQKITNP